MMEIVLVYPLPHRCLMPNNRPRNHGYFASLVKMRRLLIMFSTVGQVRNAGLADNLKWKQVTVNIVWYAKTLKIPDADNALASLKSTIDGIADSGLVLDDKYLSYEPLRYDKDKSNPRVEITLTEMGE